MMWDLHTHTTFSDGENTPEQMVLAAIDLGMSKIGFSDHSYTFFDESYCLRKDRQQDYRNTIRQLSEKYRDRINVLLGIEQDYYSRESTDGCGYDYIIGSVHYLKFGDSYVPVDEAPQNLRNAARLHFGGDIMRVVETYFATVAAMAEQQKPTIIGHFDLIKKHNGDGSVFDETAPRYRRALTDALDRVLACHIPFEVNTGAIAKGYRRDAYPSPEWVDYIKARGGQLILSSDSHTTRTLCYHFSDYTIS